MIYESFYWKTELYKNFVILAKSRNLKRMYEISYMKIQRALMFGAYIIRKLDEAQKIPPDFMKKTESLTFFINKGKNVDHLNWHKIDINYNLKKQNEILKDWGFIINQIIHSFTYICAYDETNKLDGFFINSDYTKKDKLFYLSIKTILTMFLTISEGSIIKSSSKREVISKKEDGTKNFGAMKLTQVTYSYPDGFNLNTVIINSLNGNIYKRIIEKG